MVKNHGGADPKRYELMLVLNPDLDEKGIKNRLDDIRSHLKKEAAAENFYEEDWGLRDLAYPIKKHRQGYYMVMDFSCDPAGIQELKKMLLLEPEVLRHLVVVLPLTYKPQDYTRAAEETEAVAPSAEPVKEEKKKTAAKKSAKASEDKDASSKKKTSKKSGEPDSKLDNILENPDLNF